MLSGKKVIDSIVKPSPSANVIWNCVCVAKWDYFSKQKTNATQTQGKMIEFSEASH